MKIRLILLSLLGLALYIVLASYNSKMLKDNPVPAGQNKPSASQTPLTQPSGPEHKPDLSHPAQDTTAEKAVRHEQPQENHQAAGKGTEAMAIQPLAAPVQPEARSAQQQLESELAKKEQQIKQLLDAQETVAAKYRTLLEQADADKAAAKANEGLLRKAEEQIGNLTADQKKTTGAMEAAQKTIAQLQETLGSKEKSATEVLRTLRDQEAAARSALEKQLQDATAGITALKGQLEVVTNELTASKEGLNKKEAALNELEVSAKKAVQQLQEQGAQIEQLTSQLAEANAQASSTKATAAQLAQAEQEKEELLQKQNEQSEQLKEQLAKTNEQLVATQKDLNAAEQKASTLALANQEQEKQQGLLAEQKQTVAKNLQEKTEALAQALFSVQTLKQEIAAQPQATATIQSLLDDRTRECEQLKTQISERGTADTKISNELNRCKTDAEAAQKKIMELESVQVLTQTSLTEADRKMTAALDSKKALEEQLRGKEAVVSGEKDRLSQLMAQTKSLQDEKIGFISQLEAMKGELNTLQPMKAVVEEKAAALAKAEAQLQNMAGLKTQLEEAQAKNNELTKSLEEKATALADAAKQAEQLSSLQNESTELQTKIKTLTAAADESASTLKLLETEKADLTAQLQAAQAQAKDIANLKTSLDEKASALMLAETKIKELSGSGEQIALLEGKLTDNTVTMQKLQAANQAAEQKVVEAEAAMAKINESLNVCSSTSKTCEDGLAAARTRITTLEDEHELQKQQDIIPNLNQQIATLRQQLGQAQTIETQTKQSLIEVNTALAAKNEATQAAEKKTTDLLREKDELQQSLNSCQATIGDLQAKVSELQAQSAQPSAPQQLAAPVTSTTQATAQEKAEPAVDQDKDGVIDQIDLCPDTPAGTAVNELGCPQKSGIVLEGVNFKPGTADLMPEAQKALDKVVTSLKRNPQLSLEVAGYTDSAGDPKRNLELSAERSRAVVNYLIAGGIAAQRLTSIGFGAEKPIADNGTASGRSKNRRVELHPKTH